MKPQPSLHRGVAREASPWRVVVLLLVAVACSGCDRGRRAGGVSFPGFVRAQIQATPALERADAVFTNDLDFVDVRREDENQFNDILGN